MHCRSVSTSCECGKDNYSTNILVGTGLHSLTDTPSSRDDLCQPRLIMLFERGLTLRSLLTF